MRIVDLVLPLVFVAAFGTACRADESRPLLGAIRWDAWHSVTENRDKHPVRAMELSLGPKQYHYRLPFFAKVISENEVSIPGYTQEIVDREIAYAKAGGLDYWAFLLYDPDSSMSQGLRLYLSSKHKADMRFCAIASAGSFGKGDAFGENAKRIVDLMLEPSYQKVMDGRPLLYLFDISDQWIAAWGGEKAARKLFDDLRASIIAKGLKDPYIVLMDFNPAQGKKVADIIGAQGLSMYAAGSGAKGATPYAKLAQNAKNIWKMCAGTGAEVVPIAMAGWDRRPRIEHPVPWEKYQKPGVGLDDYFIMPTPAELAAHLKDAMEWTQSHADKCPAQAVITYAWNEHDEGGYLCPTLRSDGSADTSRLDAIAAMLKSYRKQER